MALYREILRLAHESGIQDHFLTDEGIVDRLDYDRIITDVTELNSTTDPATNLDDVSSQPFAAGMGANTLSGTTRSEIYLGGDGNDTLVVSGGDDVLAGGSGQDTYIFNGWSLSGMPAPYDYQIVESVNSETDTIVFTNGDIPLYGINMFDLRSNLPSDGRGLVIYVDLAIYVDTVRTEVTHTTYLYP